jgi:hypothetical protein
MKKNKRTKTNPKISKALKARHKAASQEKIATDPDYICAPKHNNSLATLIERYPNGAPDSVIARVLRIKPEQVKAIFEKILTKLKESYN